MRNLVLLSKTSFDSVRIMEIARASAEYFLSIFSADDETDIFGVIYVLGQCCMKRNEVAAYIKIRRYCKRKGFELPEYFNEIAADADRFDYYCRQLVYYMAELSR